MIIRTRDRSPVSFRKLSDDGVWQMSELAREQLRREYFNSSNFQYIVNHVAEMFGYAFGTVTAQVEERDTETVWVDRNKNGDVDVGEFEMRFTMNAQMRIYQRESTYGKNFMYYVASRYGYPIVFGVVAHEIGHMIAHHALDVIEKRLVQGRPALVFTQRINGHWDELCADYLAGVVLAKAAPPLDPGPMKAFLSTSVQSETHPDGGLRCYAVDMGYMWGRNNPPQDTSAVIARVETQKQLLESFFYTYYQGIYARLPYEARAQLLPLSNALMQPSNLLVGFL